VRVAATAAGNNKIAGRGIWGYMRVKQSARRTHPRRVRRVGFRPSIHGTLHHLLPCPNTKTGGGESAAGAATVPAETQASPAYTTQWLHRPRRPPAFPSRFIAFAARDASSQARFARHGGGPAPGATAALCYGGARGQRRRRNSARALMRVRCVSIGAAVVVALSRPAHAMDLPRCRRFPFLPAVVIASFFQKRHRGSPINFYPPPGLASGLPLVSALLSASTLEWPSSPSVHGVVCA
jgi:hypothetical protein